MYLQPWINTALQTHGLLVGPPYDFFLCLESTPPPHSMVSQDYFPSPFRSSFKCHLLKETSLYLT